MISRIYIVVKGAVQGVGFRPFIYNLAIKMNLKGYVLNSSSGVYIEAEQEKKYLDEFLLKIEKEKPALAVITGLEFSFLDATGYTDFQIKKSENNDDISALILPDIAVCDECKKELFDPSDRRYRYPFINCTNCGPRFSIVESLPYDRANTSMKDFIMCDRCREEYENPGDRRFHAQPIACPDCGPQIELWDSKGQVIAAKDKALKLTAGKIKGGKIIALKGLGGFQLIADASNEATISLLRERKHREEKPFALMFPDIESVKKICTVSLFEERLLKSPESPVVLLKRESFEKSDEWISDLIAPHNPYLGVMLPYTPLHLLLMDEFKQPVVATSGNISEEPMCIDNDEALENLNKIADYFLVHNRPIVRHVDDSIAKIILDKEMITRRARGYAPFPVKIKNQKSEDYILAVGGHLKNTIALKVKDNVFVSQHIGDLSTAKAFKTFTKVINDLQELYNVKPNRIVADKHPEYLSTKFARSTFIPFSDVQHHFTHVAACRGENQITGKTLGISWDGTGYGEDNTIWGGEFFISDENHYSHFAQMKKFPLPGGITAIREPRRSALGVLYSICGDRIFEDKKDLIVKLFSESEISILRQMLNKNLNSVFTSSAGRLFDAAASLLNLCHFNNYEGQAAMILEFSAIAGPEDYYPFEINPENIFVIDWYPVIKSLLADKSNNLSSGIISGKFHNTLAQIILAAAKIAGEEKIVLSGGCFQNTLLLEKSVKLLEKDGFKVYWHQRIPPNDGGISLGQVIASEIKSVPLNYFYKKENFFKEIN
jgi:hydrogenase maturation protein HypF